MKKILLVLLGAFAVLVLLDNLGKGGGTTEEEKRSSKFGPEKRVEIVGYDDHAMEPFISGDGSLLFWNSLNDAKNTSIFYARKVDDLHFEFAGEVRGVNGKTPHLDGVASMDDEGNFYWVSLRGYPAVFENYQHGTFRDGAVSGVALVAGDFYIREPGWIIMDAEISRDGDTLYFVNAYFDGSNIPSKSDIGIARKNGEAFVKDGDSGRIFENVNTEAYPEYAPAVSADGLTLYFSRLKGRETFVYVAERSTLEEPFGEPELLPIEGLLPEGVTVTADGSAVYYHKKVGPQFEIYRMVRR